MNYNDIAEMLSAGKSADEIAKEFTDALNKAQAEVKAQEAKKTAAAEHDAKLNEVADRIAVALQDYLVLNGIEAEGLTGAEIRDLLDEFAPMLDRIKSLKVKVEKMPVKSADDIFAKWFKLMNW